MKKILSFALALAMCLCLASPVIAAEATSGTCGENLTWTYDDGTLTISGDGAMQDYDDWFAPAPAAKIPWGILNNQIKTVVINNSVTSIGDHAFGHCDNLTNITIPDSVTSIGDSAFSSCASLTSITIPDSVTSIGGLAFYGCDSLTSVTIPSSVTSIGYIAFADCDSLTTIQVDISNRNYASLNGVLFTKDTKTLITYPGGKRGQYTIPDSVSSIGDHAFGDCDGLTSITIPDSVTSIGDYAFIGCDSLTNVTIPNSVTSIGDWAFRRCDSLTSVTIPSSVTNIGNGMFDSCTSLTSVTIPSSVTSIGNGAFDSCTSLTTIQVDTSNRNYASVNGALFTKDTKTLITYPGGKQGPYTIPNSVTSIGDRAFWGCTSLTSVTIPNSVTSIGYEAFRVCESLTSVTIPNGVTSIGDWAFDYCTSLTDVYYTGTEAQWSAITIGKENDELLNATIHYNSATPTPQQPVRFTDVPSGQWYSEAVAWAVDQGITNGTSANSFSPNKTCTNAEIITFLYRANNSPKISSALPFTPKNSWATDALKWAYSKGIIGADFDEQTPCTRYTTVEYFWKAFDRPNAQTSTNFSDISNYNDIPIAWAVQNGITNGTSATTFSPDTTCNRAMIVTLLQRAYGK